MTDRNTLMTEAREKVRLAYQAPSHAAAAAAWTVAADRYHEAGAPGAASACRHAAAVALALDEGTRKLIGLRAPLEHNTYITLMTEARAKANLARQASSPGAAADAWLAAAARYHALSMPECAALCEKNALMAREQHATAGEIYGIPRSPRRTS